MARGKLGRRSKCKDCEASIARAKRLANPQPYRDAAEKYRLSNPEVIARKDARYYKRHSTRLNEKTKKWRKDNPEKYAELNRRKERVRRSRKFENGVQPYTETQVLDLYGTACHLCGERIDLTAPRQVGVEGWEIGLHIDHLLPISKGGADVLENVKPSHGKCNLDKGSTV